MNSVQRRNFDFMVSLPAIQCFAKTGSVATLGSAEAKGYKYLVHFLLLG